MAKLIIPKNLAALKAYRGGASSFAGINKIIKLSSNEGAFGASPKAVRAFKRASTKKTLARYPEGSAAALREALGEKHKINPNQIICGAGSDELLQLLTRFALYKGGTGLHTTYGFALYSILIRAAGGTPRAVPEKNFRADVDGLIKAATPKTKILLLANPNNPTGTYLNSDELKFLRKKLPPSLLLVLDAAYAEYVSEQDYEAGIQLVKNNDNVVMTRTFSKIYGLASLRLGWAFLPAPLADIINLMRLPFNVPAPTLAAGVAALNDDSFINRAARHNEQWRIDLQAELADFNATASQANFLLLDFKTKTRAGKAFRFLGSRGLILRHMDEYGLPAYLRLSIGTPSANRKVLRALKAFVAES